MATINYSKTLLNNVQLYDTTFGLYRSTKIFLNAATAFNKPYFFLEKELYLNMINYNDFVREKLAGNIRHCRILYGSKTFYDYIVHKEFNSLEEWAADCGYTIDNIRYGINRPYISSNERNIDYINIHSLVNSFTADKLVYNTPEQRKETIETILAREGLTEDDLWIQTCGNHMVSWRNFVKTC
jgi:hypothetical protein